jgi:ubiquinone/menaquinone biosynthesis C-methylase UbiE
VKLNRVEKALMNNPARSASQRLYEARLLEKLGGKVAGANVLEVGCGRGVGTQIIFDHFDAGRVRAFDLDPDMIDQARKRLSSYDSARLQLSVGDVTEIDAFDASFDAVFDFGTVHHVPDWESALDEIARVLKPGGRFFFEEVTKHALDRWSYRTFLDHPSENRFTAERFVSALEERSILVAGNYVERFFGDFVIGVGERTPPSRAV